MCMALLKVQIVKGKIAVIKLQNCSPFCSPYHKKSATN